MKINEFEMSKELEKQLQELLSTCFSPDYPPRAYYKQISHCRYIAFSQDQAIGQVGIDYRIMSLNRQPIKVMGVVDLCVHPQHRGQGLGSALLGEVEALGRSSQADFVLLFADDGSLYERNGYTFARNACTWLKIHEHTSLGLGNTVIDCLMVKSVGNRPWEEGELDLMGYMY